METAPAENHSLDFAQKQPDAYMNPQKKHYREFEAGVPNEDHFRFIKNHDPQHYNFDYERNVYNKEKLLLEQDAHLLEEQRYLSRLKRSEMKRN